MNGFEILPAGVQILGFSLTPLSIPALAAALLFVGGQAAIAADPSLELPISCQPGRDCFIQNYVDRDPGQGWQDYACGHLSYDGHAGTDFRLIDLGRMRRGVEVLAAAAGTVVGIRDGEDDVSISERPLDRGRHRDAGNGVRIAHADGWETQYSHMRKGSLRVRVGQKVAQGEALGLVGLSGNTEFPHVDFAVRKNGTAVDPFAPEGGPCGSASSPLWSRQALAQLAYQPSGILTNGFADRVLSRREMESGESFQSRLSTAAPAIVFHVEVFGVRQGDRETLRITAPDGRIVVEKTEALGKDLAIRRVHLGKRASTSWPAGEYVGYYALRRGQNVAVERSVKLVVGPGAEAAGPAMAGR